MLKTVNKRVCDMCGKKIRKNGYRIIKMRTHLTNNVFRKVYAYGSDIFYDLCPSCGNEPWHIIRKEINNAGTGRIPQ